MKNFIITLTCILNGAFFLTSCSDEYLEPKPLSFFSPEIAFSEPSGYEAALVTLRKDLTREHTTQKNFIAHQTMASEIGVPWLTGSNDWRLLTPTTEANQRFVSQINDILVIIKNANTIISRIDNIEWGNEAERNKYLSEALWHRSYWYYRLIGCYGDLPFVKDEVTGAKLDYKTHSRWAILDQMQKDMEWAVNWMAETGLPGQPTSGAGNHLLTKIYLANLEWDKAISSASAVINDGRYSLMTQRFGVQKDDPKLNLMWDLHRPENKNLNENTETILAFVDRYDAPPEAKTIGLYTMRVYNPSYWHSVNNKDREGNVGFLRDGTPMGDTLGAGNPDCVLSDWYTYEIWSDGNYDWKTTPDIRRADANWYDREEYFYNNPESVQYGEPFDPNNMSIDPRSHLVRIYPTPMHKIFVPNTPEQTGPSYGSNGDWYIYRLAETYLLRAEASFWKGDLASAAADINVVRQRSGATEVSASDITIDYIFDERARELALEEPRQNELNRVSYIMAKLNLNGYSLETIHANNWLYDRIMTLNEIYTRENYYRPFHIDPHNYQWPIADALIDANTLGRINQNIGYTGAERNEPPLTVIE